MAQKLNPFSGIPFLDANGDPYSGAQLFIYTAGTSTKFTTTKDLAGASNHANPVVLNSSGVIADGAGAAQAMWQLEGQAVKMVLAPSTDTDPPIAAIRTYDNIQGVNDETGAADLSGYAQKGTTNVFTKTQTWAKGADVASATALPLGTDGNYFDVTGTTAITSIATAGIGTTIGLHFDGALTFTHHATDLILPGGANITTAAGDEATLVEYASGDWRCLSYTKASGETVLGAAVLKDTSGNLTVGHTTDLEAVSTITAASTYTPDITLEALKRASVTGSFTLARPTEADAGVCKVEMTIDVTGGYTMTLSNYSTADGTFDGTANAVNLVTITHWDTSTNADIVIRQRT